MVVNVIRHLAFEDLASFTSVLQAKNIEVNYPLLIISGEKDIELVRRMGIKWHESEPTSKYHLIRNAGHCANMDNPDEFNKTVKEFIDSKDE